MTDLVTFDTKLQHAQADSLSLLCVGLDPDPARLPPSVLEGRSLPDAVLRFALEIVDATREYACAYKLNFAFYEALGPEGWRVLQNVSAAIPSSKITIADAKRGDIGNTGRFYAEAIFAGLQFDACTVSPYMGRTSVEPFLQYRGKAAFVVTRTSNPDAEEIQTRTCDGEPLYRRVARLAQTWSEGTPGDAGLVVGATDREAIADLRSACPSLAFLIPGIGAQGGDLASVIRHGLTADGRLLVNSSRSVIYASAGSGFATAAADAARSVRDEINRLRDTSP